MLDSFLLGDEFDKMMKGVFGEKGYDEMQAESARRASRKEMNDPLDMTPTGLYVEDIDLSGLDSLA